MGPLSSDAVCAVIPLSGGLTGLHRSPAPLMPPPCGQKAGLQGAAPVAFLKAGWGRVTGASPLPGSDKEAILELITSRSNRQRQEIIQSYKSLYGKVTMATGGRVNGSSHVCLQGLS